jgi:hypothetical protein
MKGKVYRVGSDPILSLKDLSQLVDEWIQKFGERAVFTTNAGFNNVTLCVDNRKEVMTSYKKGEI